MTLQVSGPISLEDIQTEFGGSNPIAITEYYRGGVNVPDTAANASIPTSGTISLEDFYGGDASAGATILLTNRTVVAVDTTSSLRTLATGQLQTSDNGGLSYTNITNEWATPLNAGNGALYEINVNPTSGSVTGSATNTWLALSSTRTWTNITPNTDAVLTVQIRLNGGAVQDTATITLNYTTVGR